MSVTVTLDDDGAERAVNEVQWPERFLRRLVPTPHGCVYWTGSMTKGYGTFSLWEEGKSRTVLAHRWVYTQLHGPLDPAADCMHHCDEPLCVAGEGLVPVELMREWNVPEKLIPQTHLTAGSHTANMRQMSWERRSAGAWHSGYADSRGDEGRSAALRAALADGFDPDRLAAAMLAGETRPRVRKALRTYDPAAFLLAVDFYRPQWEEVPLF